MSISSMRYSRLALLGLVFITASVALGQQTWFWRNPLPQGNDLIAVHVFDANTIVAVGYAGTVIRTTNAGTTWTVKSFVEGQNAYFVDVAFANQNVGYAVGFNGIIIRTTNGGVTWRSQTSGTTQSLYGVCMISPDIAVVVGSQGSILRTTNGGSSWTFQTSGTTQLLTHVAFGNSNVGTIVGASGVILRTTDAGITWSPQTSGTTQALYGVAFTDANNGTAVGNSGTILRTTDGGVSWSPQTSGTTGALWGVVFTGLNTGYASGFDLSGGGGLILRTVNGGASWTQQMPAKYVINYGIAFADVNNGVAVSVSGGILRTTNGGVSWTDMSSGPRRNLRGVFFGDGNNGIAVGDSGMILQTTNGGNAWVRRDSLTPNYLFGVNFADANTGIIVGSAGTILRTINGGTQWSALTSGTTADLNAVAFATGTTAIAGGSGGAMLQSTNQGVSWIARTSGTASNLYGAVFLTPTTGVAVGSSGAIVRTTDAGATWTVISSPTSNWLYGVARVSSTIAVAVGDAGTVLRSSNGGLTWATVTSGTSSTLTSVSFQDASNGTIVGGGIVLNTVNGGLSWTVHPLAANYLSGVAALPGRKRVAVGVSGTILSTSVFQDSVAVSSVLPFPSNPTSSTDYRLFGLPGNAAGTATVGSILSGSPPNDWRMFRDNGASSNYLVELSAASTLTSGEGYWLLKRGNLNFTGTIALPPISTSDIYSIPLHAGWNIIANPFDKPVSWLDVGAANNRLDTVAAAILRGYNGSYTTSTTMAPFAGYYFFNDPAYGLSSLRIPYPFAPTSPVQISPPPMEWQLQLVYESDVNRDPENYVGISSAAKVDRDMMDVRKPPLFLDQGFLCFSRPEWDATYPRFSSDIRPSMGDGQVWQFEVVDPRKANGTIQVLGIDQVPPQYSVILVDEENTTPHDLRRDNSYTYRVMSEKTTFKLIIGNDGFVKKEISTLMPNSFELAQNYPNPFNPSTAIRFNVAHSSHVQLEVYSILGQRTATLIDGQLEAGVYTVRWDSKNQAGNNVSTGVYFYRMLVDGNLVQTRKMLLAK